MRPFYLVKIMTTLLTDRHLRSVGDTPTVERLNEVYEYKDGKLISKISRSGCSAGVVCGSKMRTGYIRVGVDGDAYLAHRIVWKMHHGCIDSDIDHVNGDKSDNRIENLRQVSKSENQWNWKEKSNNKSGFMGVYWDRHEEKWAAKIAVFGKQRRIGRFRSLLDAVLAYNKECKKLHGEYAERKISKNIAKLKEIGLIQDNPPSAGFLLS